MTHLCRTRRTICAPRGLATITSQELWACLCMTALRRWVGSQAIQNTLSTDTTLPLWEQKDLPVWALILRRLERCAGGLLTLAWIGVSDGRISAERWERLC